MDGTEGPGNFDELNKLVVASQQPLQTVGVSKSRAEGEGRARGVKVEDRDRKRRDRCGGGGGEKVFGGGGRQGRVKIGGRDTRCSGGESERAREEKNQRGKERKRRELIWWEEEFWVNQSEVREDGFDEEARKRKLKRREDCVKRHENIFGENQWETRRGEGWGFLGPLPSHEPEGVASCELRWWGRGGRDSTVSPPVVNGVGGICARGIQ